MILSGKEVSSALKAGLAAQVATFPEKYGRAPHLAVILVGDNPASQIYVRNKAKACESIGITNTTITMPADSTEEAVLAEIKRLNEDSGVDGILVQLPVPKQINTARIIEAIAREKDVDGFHPGNVAALWQKMPCMVPCTPKGIMKLLAHAGVDPKGKRAVVIGRSNIVGLPVAKLLLDARTVDLPSITRQAEILVVAAGAAKMVTGDMVSDGVVVIDVGMDHDADGKLCGDVDYDSVAPKASWITPVPGGVGPMTIACLMENTVEAFLAKQK